MKAIFNIAALALVATAAACVPSPPNYVPPQNLTLKTGASVVGSLTVDPAPLLPDTTIELASVDNQPTNLGRNAWKIPVLLTPGSHVLITYICKCSLLGGQDVTGPVTLVATVKPGVSYTIRTSNPTGFNGFERHFATVWIEDETGAAITPKAKFEIDRSNPPIVQFFEH